VREPDENPNLSRAPSWRRLSSIQVPGGFKCRHYLPARSTMLGTKFRIDADQSELNYLIL
jgi:hypothetical protein